MPFLIFILSIVLVSGCATPRGTSGKPLDREETEEALEIIAEAISGKNLTDEEVNHLKKQIRNDPDAQSAIKAITNSVSGEGPRIKYSPATGKRYAPHLETDPETGVKLEWVE